MLFFATFGVADLLTNRTPHPPTSHKVGSNVPTSPLGKVKFGANIFHNNMDYLCFTAGGKTVGAIHESPAEAGRLRPSRYLFAQTYMSHSENLRLNALIFWFEQIILVCCRGDSPPLWRIGIFLFVSVTSGGCGAIDGV